MRRRLVGGLLIGTGVALAQTPAPARAQAATSSVVVGPVGEPPRGFFEAPGYYGMSLGTPSFGSVRSYSSFSSSFGAGYAYGYPPYGILPGRYGAGIWRPGLGELPLFNAAYHSYRTFPVPYRPGVPAVTPPVGLYAPAFGPPSMTGH
jgi:hypothetical protein